MDASGGGERALEGLVEAPRAVPRWRRPMFAALRSVFPDVDPERTWNWGDLHAPKPGEVLLEERLDRAFRSRRTIVRVVQLALFLAGVACVWAIAPRLAAGRSIGWTIAIALPCGLFVHGLFILVVHEATHLNVLGKKWDGWLASFAMGALLLPFLAEKYQGQHIVHHRITNGEGDTNWTPLRHALWTRSRWLYAIYELVPLVNNLDRVREKWPTDRRRLAVAWATAALVVLVMQPGLTWWALVVVGLNTTNALRLWTEHFGTWQGRVSNAYACPLGFGIGNHEVHHLRAKITAPALLVGLWFRRRDRSIFTSPLKLLFARNYGHFRTFQPDFRGDNP